MMALSTRGGVFHPPRAGRTIAFRQLRDRPVEAELADDAGLGEHRQRRLAGCSMRSRTTDSDSAGASPSSARARRLASRVARPKAANAVQPSTAWRSRDLRAGVEGEDLCMLEAASLRARRGSPRRCPARNARSARRRTGRCPGLLPVDAHEVAKDLPVRVDRRADALAGLLSVLNAALERGVRADLVDGKRKGHRRPPEGRRRSRCGDRLTAGSQPAASVLRGPSLRGRACM